jgi:hypothetical protein
MESMHDSPSEKVLRREVQPPQHQPSGLGLMLIASAAMFFAVAGSAFVVRARMAGHCCDRALSSPPAVRPAPLVTGGGAPCGEAVYRANPDGTVSVDFRLCPPEEEGGQTADGQSGLVSPLADRVDKNR